MPRGMPQLGRRARVLHVTREAIYSRRCGQRYVLSIFCPQLPSLDRADSGLREFDLSCCSSAAQGPSMNRRDFLQRSSVASLGASVAASAAASLVGCGRSAHAAPAPAQAMAPAQTPATATGLAWYDAMPALEPIRAHTDRLFRITVCLRPFRAQGPRIEAERIGDKLVVHNYGHGGSGWSLSWGSSALAIERAWLLEETWPVARLR